MGVRRRRRWPWLILFCGIGLTFLFYAFGGWLLSSRFHAEALAAGPYSAEAVTTGTITALNLKGGKGTVEYTVDSAFVGDQLRYDYAVMGLSTREGTLVVGPVASSQGGVITRPVQTVIGRAPEADQAFGLHPDVWLTPQDAGLDDEDVMVRSLGGLTFPAWAIPSEGSTGWAILVHDKDASRSEMLRMARPMHKAKLNVLVVSYTNDPGAPESGDGMLHYGRSEWQDLEAAVQYVVEADAEQIILGGSGHGGAVVLGFLARGSLASRVSGVVLDSPVASLRDLMDARADLAKAPIIGVGIPESLEEVAVWAVSARYNVDFRAVDYSSIPGLIDVPLLTFQGRVNQTVPLAVNDRFMGEGGSGENGDYVVVPGADHMLTWNVDPKQYDERIGDFLAQVKEMSS